MERSTLLWLGVIAVVVSAGIAAGAGWLANDGAEVNCTNPPCEVVLNIGNGPNVTVNDIDDGGKILLQDQSPAPNTIRVETQNGNATFVSKGDTDVRVNEINGTWTNVSHVDATTAELMIDPDDKRAANVSGDIDHFQYRDSMSIDDGVVDFAYGGAAGTSTVTVRGLPANKDVRAVEGSTLRAGGTTNGDGELTLTGMANSDHTITLQSSDGGPALSNPTPEGQQSDFPTTLTVDVDDPDFDDGENVTVDFELDGAAVGSDKLTSAGTASTSISKPSRGSHTVTVTATDSVGNTNTLTWEFSVPNKLFIREARDPWALIDDREATVTFYQNETAIETRSTTNGEIDLEGLNTGDDIVISANASTTSCGTSCTSKYHGTELVIEDITQQNTVYLLDQNATTVEVRFTLEDRTGDFEGNGGQLFIQKVVNRTGDAEWQTIHADEFGVNGVTTDLEKGTRYRLLVKNDDNDVRVLGTYTAEVSETVPLTVGTVSANPENLGLDWTHNATYLNESATSTNYVQFEYNDSADLTDGVTVEIHERGDRSNKLVDNQTFSGPLGSFKLSEPVPSGEENKTWVVRATVDRGGEVIEIQEIVGPQRPILGNMDPWVKAVISVGTIFVVAGLFSQLNGDVGALVVAGLGGMFWFVDFLPRETGVGVVVLAMVTAGVVFINERRSAAV